MFFRNGYFWIWLFGGAPCQGGEEAEAGRGDTDEQPLSDKPPLIQCGETQYLEVVIWI